MSAIRVRGLVRAFAHTQVLTGCDLVVELHERVTVTGDNGAGKTTLLRVLAGLLRPDDGEVTVLGGSPSDVRIRRRLGVVGHAPPLYPRMTAGENLRFWARMYDDPTAVRRGTALLAALGLDPEDRRHVTDYSQGMRQRVALARALQTDPELVLADEPFAGLDAKGADVVGRLLGDGRTVLIATHTHPLPDSRRLELLRGRLVP